MVRNSTPVSLILLLDPASLPAFLFKSSQVAWAVYDQMPHFRPSALTGILSSYAKLGHNPGEAWFLRVCTALAPALQLKVWGAAQVWDRECWGQVQRMSREGLVPQGVHRLDPCTSPQGGEEGSMAVAQGSVGDRCRG